MQAPMIHANGTSREVLLQQVFKARQALRAAIEALELTAPHNRDYYLLSPEAWRLAHVEHGHRVSRLQMVHEELLGLFEMILEQD